MTTHLREAGKPTRARCGAAYSYPSSLTDDPALADCEACLAAFPAIGVVDTGRGELAGGDVQAVQFNLKRRRPSRHDQRTPLPGDPGWKGRHHT
jgi:hypothetical protein